KGFREAVREVLAQGMAEADFSARVVWIPRAIHYNAPESPNVVRSWAAYWDEIPEGSLKTKAYQQLKDFLEAFGKGFGQAFDQACDKPSAKASSNQEQEQEQEQNPPQPPKGGAEDFERLWSAWPARRRTGKGAALRVWKKATGKAAAETIIAAAREYAASPVG